MTKGCKDLITKVCCNGKLINFKTYMRNIKM